MLAAEMRRLKDKSRLSYGRLADKTHYSRSSWERFLNGKQLPTTVAVEEFAAAVEAYAEPLLVLLETAKAKAGELGETGGAGETSGAGETGEAGEPRESAPPEPDTALPDTPLPGPFGSFRLIPAWDWKTRARGAGLVAAGALAGCLLTLLVIGTAGAGDLGAFPSSSRAGGGSTAAGAATLAQHTRQAEPTPQNPRPGCSADTCLRRDPQSMDCQWDATTAHQTWLRGMHIELRYSPACGAVWGRLEDGTVGDSVTIRDKYGDQLSATIRVDRDTYTRMLAVDHTAPPSTVTVCGAIPKQHEIECSPVGSIQP
ncbi:hypothetical protein AQI88_36370 [Streptomyces cellostaticus]|uniref:HTH cro/C1-type domain-containing protein n=1 Tax=Streptomyces cellostaticus TaxID=67285 RepID=A0A101NE65_9ACTN|nr:XRE family transcriptional regulator [Streptomyces cellostaticus]KUM91571.1 hypothetical protein AQI88_36370 [Streptomyces cellostaticus]